MAHTHPIYDSDHHFIIDPITRAITSTSKKVMLVQGDHNSERFTFEVPRKIEGHDVMDCNSIKVHYNNIDIKTKEESRDIYEVTDKQVSPEDENIVVLSWLIRRTATQYVGSLNFLLRFSCITEEGGEEYAWNTAICSGITISDGLYNSEVVVEEYADVLEQWRQDLFDTKDLLAMATVQGDTLVIENAAKPTSNELAQRLADGSFVVQKANAAGSATNAEYANNDDEGNYIPDTYAKKSDLYSGFIKPAKAIHAETADKATFDESGNRIVLEYATKEELKETKEGLTDGTFGVKKAEKADTATVLGTVENLRGTVTKPGLYIASWCLSDFTGNAADANIIFTSTISIFSLSSEHFGSSFTFIAQNPAPGLSETKVRHGQLYYYPASQALAIEIFDDAYPESVVSYSPIATKIIAYY